MLCVCVVFCNLAIESNNIPLRLQMLTGEEVAVKLESTRTRHPQLAYESKIYRILHGGCEYIVMPASAMLIPYLYWTALIV